MRFGRGAEGFGFLVKWEAGISNRLFHNTIVTKVSLPVTLEVFNKFPRRLEWWAFELKSHLKMGEDGALLGLYYLYPLVCYYLWLTNYKKKNSDMS